MPRGCYELDADHDRWGNSKWHRSLETCSKCGAGTWLTSDGKGQCEEKCPNGCFHEKWTNPN